jgi:GDPmannose 4,6-dehydratase
MFGKVQEIPQSETTQFYPRSPYGVSKLAAFWACKNYRESYGLFICNGILFNHESERRGDLFVTKKITKGVTNEAHWPLRLGNLDSKRDWGHARDYVYGMWLMLQQDVADDFILATGETHSIREFIDEALTDMLIEYEWRGDEVWSGDKCILIGSCPEYMRPSEVDLLVGNANKAREKLGWSPKITFRDLVHLMINDEISCIPRAD